MWKDTADDDEASSPQLCTVFFAAAAICISDKKSLRFRITGSEGFFAYSYSYRTLIAIQENSDYFQYSVICRLLVLPSDLLVYPIGERP
ncbi:hypothetical protein GCM10010969_36530 [Saccharibacillus kuerlensis]|uniref:Uncharacterized protein n=1 Tax=Saccharibacillus kuerlensis TaxID=459527 RepID=A0ABQ2LBV9_9BACL|nr:hypothetical protein GCM10010969_36530 [Saccharibacillus kuerlensis]